MNSPGLTFQCLPSSHLDEWENLKLFVSLYNHDFKTNFELVSRPELADSRSPQPELLLQDGQLCMVVERKILAWPPTNIHHHQLWHNFVHFFCEKALALFNDDIYALEIYSAELPATRRAVQNAVSVIVNELSRYQREIKNGALAFDYQPLIWRFFRVPDWERDEEQNEPGIVVRARLTLELYDQDKLNQARIYLRQQLALLYQAASRKFEPYSECIRVLVIEPFASFASISHDDFREIVASEPLPLSVDQVWLAELIETESGDDLCDYSLIKNRE